MEEPLNIVLEKEIKGHAMTVLIMQNEDADSWSSIIQCEQCSKHYHLSIDTLEDQELSLVSHELDMHAADIDGDWKPGLGFELEED